MLHKYTSFCGFVLFVDLNFLTPDVADLGSTLYLRLIPDGPGLSTLTLKSTTTVVSFNCLGGVFISMLDFLAFTCFHLLFISTLDFSM